MEERNYITSDSHLLHTNIIKYAERKDYLPFDDEKAEKMSWDIVNAINKQVPDEKDVVLWNLGDLFYGKLFGSKTLEELQAFVKVMKGQNRRLNIVLGNHDRQFNNFRQSKEDWKRIAPITKKSSLIEIFQTLGFDNVYDKPVVFKSKCLLSHEPVFIKPNSDIVNIHGHVHQCNVDEEYFTWDLENYKMVRKAYKDSGREVPPLQHKLGWEKLIVDPKNYINVCWDNPALPYQVFNLDRLCEV